MIRDLRHRRFPLIRDLRHPRFSPPEAVFTLFGVISWSVVDRIAIRLRRLASFAARKDVIYKRVRSAPPVGQGQTSAPCTCRKHVNVYMWKKNVNVKTTREWNFLPEFMCLSPPPLTTVFEGKRRYGVSRSVAEVVLRFAEVALRFA